MAEFLVQIGDTKPDGWLWRRDKDAQWAAVHVAMEAGLRDEVRVYVAPAGKPMHDNGTPMVVHALDLVITPRASGSYTARVHPAYCEPA